MNRSRAPTQGEGFAQALKFRIAAGFGNSKKTRSIRFDFATSTKDCYGSSRTKFFRLVHGLTLLPQL